MNFRHFLVPVITIFICSITFAQTGIISGSAIDKATQEALIGASITLDGTTLGTVTEIDGSFRIADIPAKSYNLTITYIGYKSETRYNVVVTSGNINIVNFEMQEESNELGEVVVSENRSTRIASIETPLSIQNLGVEEIKNNPGGNFDISKVLSTLPGVGGTPGGGSFRNDLLIRGGGPSENVYYLDGVEIPVLNHFSTQGAAGGPTGMLNVSFIEDATLISSAFPAKYDNALSSVLQFRQREGNKERFQSNFRVSGSETALTTEGPIGKKTTFLASARRSYLQFLFELIGLPIRPNYWDFQYKVVHKINPKLTFTAIGLGAIDEFSFENPKENTPENTYVLSSNPLINQWNYTQGFTLKKLNKDSYWNLTFSRNMFDNRLDQFSDNYDGKQTDESKRTLKLNSQEIENKLRFDNNLVRGSWKFSYGASMQYVKYNNATTAVVRPEIRDVNGNLLQPSIKANFNTDIGFMKYGPFGQVSKNLLDERLSLSLGLRMDGNSFTESGNEIWKTFSPRISASYVLLDNVKFNTSIGRFYKIGPYTALGFQDESGVFVNKALPYLKTDHLTGGFEYLPSKTLRFTVEGFFKWYGDYPVSALTGISLANQGADFGIVGNERLSSIGTGKSYGFEFFMQQKLMKNFFLVGSYTLFWSKFSGADNLLVPSSWDNRHLVSLTAGYKLGRNWELGVKYRLQGGTPYTPIDEAASRRNYPILGREVFDYTKLNTLRLTSFNQLDIRVDKKWNFKKFTLDLFLDMQNAMATKNPEFPRFTMKRNEANTAFQTTDGKPLSADGSNGIPLILGGSDGNALPTIGLILEF